jgi:hypothetical protein
MGQGHKPALGFTVDARFYEQRRAPFRLQRIGSVILTLWIMATLFPVVYLADHYFLLVWHYGFWRVHKESLHFVYLPPSKSFQDYIVSNGDHISYLHGFIAFTFAIVVWAVLIVIGFLLIKRTFRRKEIAAAA